MLNDKERKEILDLLKSYNKAKCTLVNHYNSKHARRVVDDVLRSVDHYLRIMDTNMDNVTSEDVKYFALIADVFEPMRRDAMFRKLQNYADFDVIDFVKESRIHGAGHAIGGKRINVASALKLNLVKNLFKKTPKEKPKNNTVKQGVQQVKQNVVGAVSNFYSDVTVKLQNLKQAFDIKKSERRKTRENKKSDDKSRNSDKKHWFKQVVRVALPVAGFALLGVGISILGVKTGGKKSGVAPVKKEIRAPQNVQNTNQESVPVSVDTAYMAAMNNYCNSAMDVIAGEKRKNDVIAKLNNQIQNGNLVLNDTVSIERVAYTYFIYREYGFNIDVLNLAVNGNQKLSGAENDELLNVINAAGDRGIGVQKMAQERVKSRGGNLGHHSKFEHATKQQQRAYLVHRGVLKKLQHNR